MNPSPIRLAVLAAAALCVCPSARADADFAASLAKPLSGLATMAQLKTQAQQPPKKVRRAAAPAEVWKILLDLIVSGGERGIEPQTKLTTFKLRDTDKVPDGIEEYSIFALGAPLPDGRFLMHAVLLDYTVTKRPPGGAVTAEQLLLQVEGDGVLRQATYYDIAANPAKPVPVNLDLSTDQTLGLFQYVVEFWTN